MMYRILLLLFLAEIAVALPPDIAATVWVRSGDRGVGTGWLVDADKRWLITARHVVGDRDHVDVFFPDTKDGELQPLRRHYIEHQADLGERGLRVAGKVLARRDTADLALIQLEAIPAGTPALRLAPRVCLGEPVHLVGHRHDAETLWTRTTGVLRQTGRLEEGYFWNAQKLGVGARVLLVQLPIEAGDSGAALLNAHGEVLGVLSAFSNRTPGVAIAIHAAEVRQLLRDVKPEPPAPTMLPVVEQLSRATAWVQPTATDRRGAGVIIDRDRRLLLTTITAAGNEDVLEVQFPQWHARQLRAEWEHYRDRLGAQLGGSSVRGIVLARDVARDLVLVQLAQLPEGVQALPVAAKDALQGTKTHAMNHPLNEELLWLYSAGSVRATAQLALHSEAKETDPKPHVCLVQLPHQASSSGGPLVNDQGELVGLLATREGPRQEMAYAVARRELEAFLESTKARWQPTTAAQWAERGSYFAHRGEAATALEAWQQARRLEPKNVLYEVQTAFALLHAQQPVRDAVAMAAQHVTTPDEQALLGQLYIALGEPKRAEPLITAALKANPKCVPALIGRASLRSGPEALADVNEALFLEPNSATAYAVRAVKHDPRAPDIDEKQRADWTRVLELRPYDRATREARAASFVATKDWKKATADWTRLAELNPTSATTWLGLANMHLLAGDEAKATAALVAAYRCDAQLWAKVRDRLVEHGRTKWRDDDTRAVQWYQQVLRALAMWRAELKPWLAKVPTDAAKARTFLEQAP